MSENKAFSFLTTLAESRLFPTVQSLERVKEKDLAEWALLNVCALRILLAEEGSHDWARTYARKTVRWGVFDKWRSEGTDLYVMLSSLASVNTGKAGAGYGLNRDNIVKWLRQASIREPDEAVTHRLFVRLDFDLHIQSSALRAVRRLVMEWHVIDIKKKQLVVTRLLQYFRSHMPKSELFAHLDRVAKHHNLLAKSLDGSKIPALS